MKTVLVAGGGITGLAAAYYLRNDFNVILLESSSELGGKLRSVKFRNQLVDVGPDSFLTRNKSAVELASELGLYEYLTPPMRQGASLYSGGKLRKLPMDLALGIPTNPISVISSQIVPFWAVLRSASDFFWPKKLPDFDSLLRLSSAQKAGEQKNITDQDRNHLSQAAYDPSIGQLFNPRFGEEMVERLIAPLIAGINAGDVRHLSFAATTPELARAVSKKRSIMLALRKYRSNNKPFSPSAVTDTNTDKRLPPFMGFDSSFSLLTGELKDSLISSGVQICLNTEIVRLDPPKDSREPWEALVKDNASGQDRAIAFDGLVLATPAFVTAKILESSLPEIAGLCQKIPFSSVATLLTAWKSEEIPDIYGTGFLVARRPKRLITGVTNLTAKWSHLSGGNEVWLKVSAGHYSDDRTVSMSDSELVEAMLQDLREILHIGNSPLEIRLCRWKNAFPQYNSGHIERIAKIDSLLSNLPKIAIVGASYHGIGIPSCISDSAAAAEKLKANLN